MQQLHLVGFTTDMESLIFSARKGAKSGSFTLPLDEDLLARIATAVQMRNGRGGADGDGVLELPEELRDAVAAAVESNAARPRSSMSPREIQARLRAGRTVEQVAAEADVDEEWVARFSPPIEAEQRQVVARAKSIALATARRGESAQPLGVSVRWNLVDKGLRMTEGEFDQCWSAAHMRDQEWQVLFRFTSRKRSQVAEWELDLRDGTLSPRNRLATELGFVEAGRRRRPAEPLPPPRPVEPKQRAAAPAVVMVPAAPSKKAVAKRSVGKSAAKKAAAKRSLAKKSAAKKSAAKRSAAKKATPKRAVAKKSAPKRAASKVARSTRSTKSLRTAKRAKTTKAPAAASRKASRQPARPAAKKATKKKAAPPGRRSARVVAATTVAPTRAAPTRPPVDELAQRRLELVGVRSAPLNPRPVRRPPPVEVRPSERQPRRPAPAPVPAAAVEAPVAAPSREDAARAERAAQRAARRSLAERRAAAAASTPAPAAAPARARTQPSPSAEPGVVPGLDVVPAPASNAGDRVVTIRADRAAPPRTRGESDEGVTVANRAPLRPISPAARPNRRRFGRNR